MPTGPSFSKFADSVKALAGGKDPGGKAEDREIELGRAAHELLTKLTHDGHAANIAALEADFGRAARALIQGSQEAGGKLAADFDRASVALFQCSSDPSVGKGGAQSAFAKAARDLLQAAAKSSVDANVEKDFAKAAQALAESNSKK